MIHLIPSAFPYEVKLTGEVEKLFTTFGFLNTKDGQRYFFHFGTCTTKPELLKVGDTVEFVLGEDAKTHRLHAQKVRKITCQDVTPVPPPTAAAILKTLPTAALYVQAQTLFTVTGLLPVQCQRSSFAENATKASENLSTFSQNLPYATSAGQVTLPRVTPSSIPVAMIPYTSSIPLISVAQMQAAQLMKQALLDKAEADAAKRPALRQISLQQVEQRQCLDVKHEQPENTNGAWDAVLFKPFAIGPNDIQEIDDGIADMGTADMGTAFRRARDAWYSVSEN